MSAADKVPAYDPAFIEVLDGEHVRSGWGAIIKGAVSPEEVEAVLRDLDPCDQFERVVSEVQHLHFHRRIMWCSRLDGFGCEFDGEWHSHWSGVQHNDASPSCCHTVALPVYAGGSR